MSRAIKFVIITLVSFSLLVAGVLAVLHIWEEKLSQSPLCAASAGGKTQFLDVDQAENAALISAIGVGRGLPARASTIALATAVQESKLRNIEHGDRDSLGLFQQRPSQGWGSADEILNPTFSINAFYDSLVQVDGYESMEITKAAQKVQRSGFPEAYAEHEPEARAFASALTGQSEGSLGCRLGSPGAVGEPEQLVERIKSGFGAAAAQGTLSIEIGDDETGGAVRDVVRVERDQSSELSWSIANWAVAGAQSLQVVEVRAYGQVWTRGGKDEALQWHEDPLAPRDRVEIVLAAEADVPGEG